MVQHTPGPWKADQFSMSCVCTFDAASPEKKVPYAVGGASVRHGVSGTICSLTCDDYTREEAEANLSLISAAPDLLEALEIAHETMFRARSMFPPSDGGHQELGTAMERARAAISKATAPSSPADAS